MWYIIDEERSCDFENVSKACFKIYCKIGNGIDRNIAKNWLRYETFESYLEDIVDDKINATNGSGNNAGRGWTYGGGNGQLETIDEVSDDWMRNLCGGLT